MSKLIQNHKDLRVFNDAFESAMLIFEMSRTFPNNERYSLTDQIRRSSRSVCANIAEAWRKRRYERSFVSKLSDAEAEIAETQVWITFAVECGYISSADATLLNAKYERLLGSIVGMMTHSDRWTLR